MTGITMIMLPCSGSSEILERKKRLRVTNSNLYGHREGLDSRNRNKLLR